MVRFRISAVFFAVLAGCLALSPAASSRAGEKNSPRPSGRFRLPFKTDRWPQVTSTKRFGAERSYGLHNGIDFTLPQGTEIFAARSGEVTYARPFELLRDWGRGYGGLVVIEHRDGFKSWYAHLGDVYVEKGQRVSPRTLLGNVGGEDNGSSTGPHLHFMIVDPDGNPLDPELVMRGRRLSSRRKRR